MATLSQPETTQSPQRLAVPSNPDARSLILCMNPRAGSGARHKPVAAIRDSLEHAGYEVRETTDLHALCEMASAGRETGNLRAVLALGGDGTASVVRGHVPLDIPLLPIPMGTENLLSRHVGQLATPQAVCRTVEQGVVVPMDLGRADNQFFLLMISAGFDAQVIRSLHENRRGNIRRTAYVRPILESVRHYKYPQMQLRIQNGDANQPPPHLCRWLFGFNLPVYALGLPIAPDAVATDGLLDVCAFERGALWSAARYLWHVVRRIHLTLPDVALCRTGGFRLEPTTAASIAYQIDGEFGGILPVDVEVLAGQLKLLVSPQAAQRLGFTLR
jgi:diacylglycerol kinase (ATP)